MGLSTSVTLWLFRFSLLVQFSACSESEPLRVGVHPWIGYESLYLAREFGWLPQGVTFVEGENATDSMRKVRQGILDAAALTLDEMLLLRSEGISLQAATILNISAGADAVLARPGLTLLKNLKGKRIAVEETAVGGIMFSKFLHEAGIRKPDLIIKDIPPNEQARAAREGLIDLAICYEPIVSRLKREGWQVIYDSRELPETIFDILAVRDDLSRRKSSLLRDLLKAHFKALAHIQNNRQDAVYRIAARQNISFDEVQRALAGVVLPDVAGNRRMLGPESSIHKASVYLLDAMTASGTLASSVELDRLFDTRYLP